MARLHYMLVVSKAEREAQPPAHLHSGWSPPCFRSDDSAMENVDMFLSQEHHTPPGTPNSVLNPAAPTGPPLLVRYPLTAQQTLEFRDFVKSIDEMTGENYIC